ncbi:MAG: hypothetical protein LBC41_08190, partial [Clostridiales bacterium]|nr:hypothetical protein [Clostridiales bacterium]
MKNKKSYKLIALLVALVVLVPTGWAVWAATDDFGYIKIETVADLKAVNNNLTGKYKLYADIDVSAAAWDPIAYGKQFKGEFDGNGFTIKGIWSPSNAKGYKGLFSVLEGATVKNLNIEIDPRGITGIYEVGGLAGVTQKGTKVDNVHVKGGKIVVTGGGYAGGLVGISRGAQYSGNPDQFTYCTVTGTATQTSGNYSGGFVGVLEGQSTIKYCEVIDAVATGYSYVAGFVGAAKSQSFIECSKASGTATGKGSYPGGFVGVIYENSTINNSSANVTVKASLSYAGGFAGAVYNESNVQGASATGDVSAKHYAGGLIGTIYNDSVLETSYATGNVSLTGGYIAGGLCGESFGSAISNCYARGNVSGGTGSATGVGGLVGYFSLVGTNTLTNSYSTGNVTGKGTTELGAFSGMTSVAFIGYNYYDASKAGINRATGTAGNWKGQKTAYPVGVYTPDMYKQDTYKNWDFVNIWTIEEGVSYPTLRQQICPTNPNVTQPPLPTPSDEPTPTPTEEPTPTPTEEPTPTETATPTPEATATATPTPEATATSTPTPEATATSTPSPAATATSTPSPTATATATPSPTATATATSSPTPTPTPKSGITTSTPTPTATATSTPTPPVVVKVVVEATQDEFIASLEDTTVSVTFDVKITPEDVEADNIEIIFKDKDGNPIDPADVGYTPGSESLIPTGEPGEYVLSVDLKNNKVITWIKANGEFTVEATVTADGVSDTDSAIVKQKKGTGAGKIDVDAEPDYYELTRETTGTTTVSFDIATENVT